jgi:hypothetical protein
MDHFFDQRGWFRKRERVGPRISQRADAMVGGHDDQDQLKSRGHHKSSRLAFAVTSTRPMKPLRNELTTPATIETPARVAPAKRGETS